MNSVAGGTKLNAKINLTYILSKGENLKPENLERFLICNASCPSLLERVGGEVALYNYIFFIWFGCTKRKIALREITKCYNKNAGYNF